MKKQFAFAALALALLSAACGKDDKSSEASEYDTTTTAAKSTPTAAASDSGKTLSLSTNDELGTYLVGPNGHTLYLFEKDSGTTSACAADPCKATWPALTATDVPAVGDGVDSTLVSSASGQVSDQVVYNGHLLYYFKGDAKPGDTNGIGIPEWYPVDGSGNKIDKD